MPRRVCVKMTSGASWANMMDMFADEKENRVSGSYRQDHSPPRRRTETFRQDRKDRYAQERSGGKTDQCAKWPVRQSQRRADPSARKRESVSRDNLPECVGHLGACDRFVIFAAMLRLDG